MELEELKGISYKVIRCREKGLIFDYIKHIELQYVNQERNRNVLGRLAARGKKDKSQRKHSAFDLASAGRHTCLVDKDFSHVIISTPSFVLPINKRGKN